MLQVMVKRKQNEPPLDDETLKLTIEELRRTNDWISNSYDKVKTKTFTFLGGGFGLLIFLYSSGDIFFPKEDYGRIFYVLGLALLIGSIVMLFVSLLPRIWEFSTDCDELEELNFEDHSHYLQYVKSNYIKQYRKNKHTYEKNQRIMSLAFYPLTLGAIIMVVLKIFGT